MKKKAIAISSITNCIVAEILSIDEIDDKIKFRLSNGEKSTRASRCKIQYDKNGNCYFISRNVRYYLKDFIKI